MRSIASFLRSLTHSVDDRRPPPRLFRPHTVDRSGERLLPAVLRFCLSPRLTPPGFASGGHRFKSGPPEGPRIGQWHVKSKP